MANTEVNRTGTLREGMTADGRGMTEMPVTVSAVLPAALTHLSVARSLASTVGVALDFDVDTIADLRMAVDEMASLLVTHAPTDGVIRLDFVGLGDRIDVEGRVAVVGAAGIDTESFGWTVLTSLVVDISTDVTPGTADDASVRIRVAVVADRGGS